MKFYGVSRSHSGNKKYRDKVIKTIQHMLDIGVDHIVAVVDATRDKENTDLEIRKVFSSEKVSVLRLEKYNTPDCWSQMLNMAIRFLEDNFEIGSKDRLFPFSNELSITKKVLETMDEVMDLGFGVVGLNFPGYTAISYKAPRNTGCVWPLPKVIELGGFPEICDSIGGMEDYCVGKILESEGFGYAIIESPEISLETLPITNQSEKEKREIAAMAVIDQILEGKTGSIRKIKND